MSYSLEARLYRQGFLLDLYPWPPPDLQRPAEREVRNAAILLLA